MPQVKKDLSAKRAAAARRRHELNPRKRTVTIRVQEAAKAAMEAAGVADAPTFASEAIFSRIRSGKK